MLFLITDAISISLTQFLANLVPINCFFPQEGYLLTYVFVCKLSLSSVVHYWTLIWIYSSSNSTLHSLFNMHEVLVSLAYQRFVLAHCLYNTEVTVSMALSLRGTELVTSIVGGWKSELNIVLYKIKDLGIAICL